MRSLKIILSGNRLFFLLLLIFSIAGILLNDILQIALHANHPAWLNVFFVNYTFMGDAVFAVALATFYFFYLGKRQTGLILLVGFILSETVVQVVKNYLSHGAIDIYSEQGQYLFFTDEATLANMHSFPSGHTAIAFVIVTILLTTIKNTKWKLLFFCGAILLGISRMYLAQHNFLELIAGAWVGVISASLAIVCAKYFRTFKKLFIKRPLFRIHLSNPASLGGQATTA